MSDFKNRKDVKFHVGDKVYIKRRESPLYGEHGIVSRYTNKASRFYVKIKQQNWVLHGKDMENETENS